MGVFKSHPLWEGTGGSIVLFHVLDNIFKGFVGHGGLYVQIGVMERRSGKIINERVGLPENVEYISPNSIHVAYNIYISSITPPPHSGHLGGW